MDKLNSYKTKRNNKKGIDKIKKNKISKIYTHII